MSRLRWAAPACAAVLLLAGCGSTVQVRQTRSLADAGAPAGDPGALSSPDGLGGGASLPPTRPGASGAGGSPAAVSGGAGSRAGSTSQGVAPGAGTTGGAAAGSGRGFDAKTLTVGYVEITGTDSAASAFGIKGADSGSASEQYAAVATWVNQHGGVAGRRLVLVKHTVDLVSALNNPDQAAAAVCAAFTQDRQVFAVLQPLPTAAQRDCLAKARTPMIEADSYFIGQPEYDKYPDLLYGAGRITSDRVIALLMASLRDRSFFTGWDTVRGGPGAAPVRIGLLHADNPEANYVAALEVRGLAALGLKVTDTVVYQSSVQAGLSATQNAILKFKADGITHVLGASAFFLQGAENQRYRPRYVLPPGIGQLYAANSPAAQMVGSMTVGWQPASDVEAGQDPGDVSPTETLCKQIMRATGQSYSSRPALASMLAVCDVSFFLRDALAGSAALSNAVLRRGAEALGSRWRSGQTFVSHFSARQHASADAVRDMAFAPDCSCVLYVDRRNRTS